MCGGMILKLVLYFTYVDIIYSIGKTGVPGIKIKTTGTTGVVDDPTDYPEFSAVIGSKVSLPCNLSPPSHDDAISLVLWYRLDLNNPVYTLDARSTSPDKAKHFSGKVLGSRAYFNFSMHRPSMAALVINPVEEGDAGEYRCRIDFRRGRTLSRMAKLNVIVPVKRVVIKGKDNITYSGMIGPFMEGTSLVLICEAQGGQPPPVVRWRQGSNPIQGTISQDSRGYVRNEIVFLRLQKEDLMTALTCQASNNNFSSPVHTSVTIDLNIKPQNVQITTPQRVLSSGEVMEVSCQSEGSRPPARISWTKGNERMDQMAIENIFGDITASTLTFVVGPDDHGKVLTCRATNPELQESALQDSWKLSVNYPPQLSLALGTSQQTEHIQEGGDVYFECNIQANPPVTDVSWRFQNKKLLHEPARGIIVRNHSLLLHNVGRRNRGTYQCLATNAQGKGKSEEAFLRIQHSPVCSSRQRTIYGVARHEEVTISCQVDSDPDEVSFRWSFNNSLGETIEILSYTNEGGLKSVVRYIPRTKLDYGILFCFAKNAVGVMKNPCLFAVVPTGPPDPLHNCTITNQTSSSLILACESTEDGNNHPTYHLEVYDMREQLLANVSSTEGPLFIVDNLPTGTSIMLVVYSSNDKGRSGTVALTATTLFSAERQTVGDTRSVISAVLLVSLAALGTLALLTVIAVVAVIKSRTRAAENAGQTVEHEMVEKFPKSTSKGFEDGNPYVYHPRNAPTEYVHLTPKSASERIYESLMDGKEANPAFEKALCKVHALKEEGLEVIMPVIER